MRLPIRSRHRRPVLTTLSCSASGIFAICCDLTRPTIMGLVRTFQSTRTRRRRDRYMPLVAFCLSHFLADFIICMCVFDFRQAHQLGDALADLFLSDDALAAAVTPEPFLPHLASPG